MDNFSEQDILKVTISLSACLFDCDAGIYSNTMGVNNLGEWPI